MKVATSQTLQLFLLLVWASCRAEDSKPKDPEELPKPEGWRAPQRPLPPGRSRFSSGPSYDPEKVFSTMSNNRAANRMGNNGYSSSSSSSGSYSKNRGSSGSYSSSSNGGYSSGSKGGGYSSNERYSDDLYRDAGYADDEQYSAYASASDYGGYGSDSGYGYSMTKYVDCNSAIALLSLILFIDILRDVVQQITNPNRRRRTLASDGDDILQFVSDGGVDALVEGLPHVIAPLLRNLSEASQEDRQEEDACVQRPMCEANAALSDRYGALGRVLGAFVSNVVARAFVGSNPSRYQLALEASKRGRTEGYCDVEFPCLSRGGNATSFR
ncbi:uncharacterized protein LOC122252100 isoform X2 [Penaeus japonicus]|uniref:uncharacterized protein LOC122252100 isoform X2 n=1 Tax=Penaeus japonicus TaxID=27405 RepID=UPI001C711405|nr:uncharacterized protein LOC122252100 isoform X2 [Penaeus japonicus]